MKKRLRIGLVLAGRLVEEREIPARKAVTVDDRAFWTTHPGGAPVAGR